MSDRRLSRKELAKQNKKQSRKRKNLRTLITIALTALLVYITGLYGASLAYLGDFLSGGMTYLQLGGGFPVQGDFSGVIRAQDMGSGLAVLTGDNFTVYSPTAKNVFTYSHSMTDPAISTSKNRAVIYQSNGTSLKVVNHHNILFRQEMQNNIIHADISASNRVAVTSRSDSYNGEVRVYNYNMEQRFVWYCATGFPVYSVLTDDGKTLAICTVQTVNGLLESEVYVIDANRGEEIFTLKSASYPQKLIFTDNATLMAVYSDRIQLYDVTTGAKKAELAFAGNSLTALRLDGTYIAAAFDSRGGQSSEILLLSHMLEEKAKTTTDEKIRDLSLSRSRLYGLGENSLYEYDYALQLLDSRSAGALSKGLVTWKGTVIIDSTAVSKAEKTKSR